MPGAATLAPPLAPCPRSLGQSPAGGAALGQPVCLFVSLCHVCAPAQLLAVCSCGPGGVCVMCVRFSVCLRWGAVCQSICPLVSVYVYCVALRVYIYLYVCVFLKLCVWVSACLYLQIHVLVYVCSFRIVCMTVCLRYEGLHMVLKACVCVCVCVCTCASAFLITDVCVILRVYFKVSIVHRPVHVQGGCVSMQGLACTKEKCLGTRVCVHVCTPVCHC